MNFMNKITDKIQSESIRNIVGKIKSDKKALIIMFAAIVGLFLISGSEFYENESKDINESSSELINDSEIAEKRLSEIIGRINGAGDVKVYITYDCEFESVFASNSDVKVKGDETQSKNEYIITDDDTGLVLKRIYPKVRGVAVVCKGADDPVIKEKIYSMVSALFDISTNKISVADME